MSHSSDPQPTQHVYRHHGSHAVRTPACEPVPPVRVVKSTVADTIPAAAIMSTEVICAREDLEVDALLELMVVEHIGCVPIVDRDGRPIGMVTKLDAVEQLLVARTPGQVPMTAGRLMMPLAMTLDARATVAHVAAMMAIESIHHVAIVAETGVLIGIVSALDVVRWLAANDGYLSR